MKKNNVCLAWKLFCTSLMVFPTLFGKGCPGKQLPPIHSQEDDLTKQVRKASAMKLFQIIDGVKVATFSKDYLIKSGFDKNDLKQWQDLTEHVIHRETTALRSAYSDYISPQRGGLIHG